jgi:hypothetical protein
MKKILDFALKNKGGIPILDKTILQLNGKLIVSDLSNTFVFNATMFENDGVYNALKSKIGETDEYISLPEDNFSETESYELNPSDLEGLRKMIAFATIKEASDRPFTNYVFFNEKYIVATKHCNSLTRFQHSGNLPLIGIKHDTISKFFSVYDNYPCKLFVNGAKAKIETQNLTVFFNLYEGTPPNMNSVVPSGENFNIKISFPKEVVLSTLKLLKSQGVNDYFFGFDIEKKICFMASEDLTIIQEWRINLNMVNVVDTSHLVMFVDVKNNTSNKVFFINPDYLFSDTLWVNPNRRIFSAFGQIPFAMSVNSSRNLVTIPDLIEETQTSLEEEFADPIPEEKKRIKGISAKKNSKKKAVPVE